MGKKYFSSKNFNSKKTKASNKFKKNNKLQPKKDKSNFVFTEESKKSLCVQEAEFTNFLSKSTEVDASTRIYTLLSNLNNLDSFIKEDDESEEIVGKIDSILKKMYTNDFSNQFSEVKYFKARVKDALGNSTSFRLYFIKDLKKTEFDIILVDPLHLAIKSRVQRNKPYRYKDNKNNDICISKLFKKAYTQIHFK